jgi:hypothetical protein
MTFSTLQEKPSLSRTSRTSKGPSKGPSKRPSKGPSVPKQRNKSKKQLSNIYENNIPIIPTPHNLTKKSSLKIPSKSKYLPFPVISELSTVKPPSKLLLSTFKKSASLYPHSIKPDTKRSTIRKAKQFEQTKRQKELLETQMKIGLYGESNNPIKSIKNTDLWSNPRLMSTNNNTITKESLDENIDNNISFLRNKQKQTMLNKLKNNYFGRKKKKEIEELIYNKKSGSYIPPQSNKGKDIKCKKKNKFECAFTRGCEWKKQTKNCNIKKKKQKPPKSICKGKSKKKCNDPRCEWNPTKKKCHLYSTGHSENSELYDNNVPKTLISKNAQNPGINHTLTAAPGTPQEQASKAKKRLANGTPFFGWAPTI